MTRLLLTIVLMLSSLAAFSSDIDFREFGIDDFRRWSNEYREKVINESGLAALHRAYSSHEPDAYVRETCCKEGCIVTRMMFRTTPHDSVDVEIISPVSLQRPAPLVIVLEDREGIALQAVNEGYVAVSLPVRGIAESVWDVGKIIDYAYDNLKVDKMNTICVGSVHAGVAAVYVGALEQRISVSVPVSSFCPSMQDEADMVMIAGLTAPRLFHVIHSKTDDVYPADQVRKGMTELKSIYAAAGNADGCRAFEGDSGSAFHGRGLWRFVRWRLLRDRADGLTDGEAFLGKGMTVRKNGRPLPLVGCGDFAYAIIDDKAPFSISVSGLSGLQGLDVSPHSSGIKVNYRKGKACFRIRQKGYYVVRIPSGGKLFLFVEDVSERPEGIDISDCESIIADGTTNITAALQEAVYANVGKTIIFPKGVYLISGLRIPSDSHLYLEEGAVILADRDSVIYDVDSTRAFVEIRDADNVSIRGAGVIDGDGAAVKRGARNRRNILMTNSSNVLLDGIVSLNPASWNTHILGCRNVTLRHFKVLNDLLVWNTDGIDPDCSQNVLVEECFAHCGDDCIAVKTTDRLGEPRDLADVTVRGCVFMTNKSALKVGTETCGASMRGIVFEDNDVIESLKPIYLRVEDGAHVSDVIYRNNRFERCWCGPSAYDLFETEGFRQEAAPYGFVIRKRRKSSALGSITGVQIKDCVWEQPFNAEPVINNPHGARLEFIIE